MRKALVISPHLDDGILSLGQFMAGRSDVDLLTVFAGFPNGSPEARYDKKMGFASAHESVNARRQEDKAACKVLRATPIHLDFPDNQYGEIVDITAIRESIANQLRKEDYELVVAPVGIAHPDHRRVREVVSGMDIPNLYYYEELPGRVLWPEQVKIRGTLTFIGGGSEEKKLTALKCYKSQWGTGHLQPRYVLLPERVWKP